MSYGATEEPPKQRDFIITGDPPGQADMDGAGSSKWGAVRTEVMRLDAERRHNQAASEEREITGSDRLYDAITLAAAGAILRAQVAHGEKVSPPPCGVL